MFLTYDRISRILFWGCVSGVIAEPFHLLGILNYWVVFLTAWLLSAGAYLALASIKLSSNGKAVIISGCDTGFGHDLALHLHRLGFRVFAGCLLADARGEGSQKLKEVASDRLHVLPLDISSQEDINKAVKTVTDTLKKDEVLWGLVNNAGINTHGAVEWVPMSTYRKICDVNLFGTIALTKAFLPLVRRAKGRVVNVGSVRGRMGSPLGTTYDITKYGIEGFSDGLRQEMRQWEVDVSIIEPGNFTAGTKIFSEKDVSEYGKAMWQTMDDGVKADYGKDYYDSVLASHLKTTQSGSKDLSLVVEAMTDALTQRFPQGRYQPMDYFIYIMVFVAQHFPEWVYDYLFVEYIMKKGW